MRKNINYFDLTEQFSSLKPQWFAEIEKLGAKGNFILGEAVSELELELAEFLDVKHAVSVSSGTDALVLSLKAAGIQPGDSVLVPNFTFFATAEAVSLVGATPKFVDIEPYEFNLCPNQLEQAVDDTCRAVIPVHLFGAPAKMERICEVANHSGLAVIEDAAQAFGSTIDGTYAGNFGDLGCFSFYPTKILGTYGDGGLITTNDDALANQLKLLRNHGITGANEHQLIGFCSRLNPVQAALLKIKLPRVKDVVRRRRECANRYMERLQGLDLMLPNHRDRAGHVFNIFTIRTSARDEITRAFQKQRIGYQIYYPKPLHKQLPYQAMHCRDEDFPESMRAASEVLSLPLYPELPFEQIDQICDVIQQVLG